MVAIVTSMQAHISLPAPQSVIIRRHNELDRKLLARLIMRRAFFEDMFLLPRSVRIFFMITLGVRGEWKAAGKRVLDRIVFMFTLTATIYQ